MYLFVVYDSDMIQKVIVVRVSHVLQFLFYILIYHIRYSLIFIDI